MRQRLNALPLEDQWALLLLMLALLLGAAARFMPGIQAGFPLNDGGMFYVMTGELIANGFALPHLTAYNGLNIPYAYPPLGFYAAGLAAALSGADLLDIFRFLPAAVSTLCIPVVYLFARELTGERPVAALAALMYALLPRAYIFLVMGGGITRAWGHLFMLLAGWMALRAFTQPQRRWRALAGLFGALTALSHPEAAMHAAAFGLALWLFYGRGWQGARAALGMGALTALMSLPWWGLMLSRHGLEPYLAAFETSARSLWPVALWYFSNFAEEPFLPVLTSLSLLGLFVCLRERRFFLPVLVGLLILSSSRSAATPVMLPVAVLAALALRQVVLPALSSPGADWMRGRARLPRFFLGMLTTYALAGAFFMSGQLANDFTLTPDQRQGFAQAGALLPQGARVLVLTGREAWQNDPAQEWFPALSGRVSLSTVQGREWLPGEDFEDFGRKVNELQALCPLSDETCLLTALKGMGVQMPIYLYADLPALRANLNLPEGARVPLLESLRGAAEFRVIFESGRWILVEQVAGN